MENENKGQMEVWVIDVGLESGMDNGMESIDNGYMTCIGLRWIALDGSQ
jgi:hypothetical protein